MRTRFQGFAHGQISGGSVLPVRGPVAAPVPRIFSQQAIQGDS
jgi:hypothetical protein